MPDIQKPHWPDNSIYFLTGSTFLHYPYFREEKQKQIVLNQIKNVKKNLNIPISAYSIAVNHYHLKFFLKRGLELARVRQIMHGGTSFVYHKEYKKRHEEMWQSDYAIVITSEELNMKIAGYTSGNLLKHKEVSTFQELEDNRFSSYWYLVKKLGNQFAQELVRSIINTEEDNDGRINRKELGKLKLPKPLAKAR